ncbi:MAG: SDR family oxidoreductase [Patescibacteria group bacterium]
MAFLTKLIVVCTITQVNPKKRLSTIMVKSTFKKVDYKNLFSLKGKIVLVTGGAGYFGQQFVRGLLDFGANRVIVVEKPGMKNSFPRKYTHRIAWYEVDLYDRQATDRIYDQILRDHKRVDVLINNAFEFSPRTGFTPDRSGVIEKATYEQFLTSFQSGIWWAFQATQKFGVPMKHRGKGTIINIASPYGVIAPSPLTYRGFEHAPNPPTYGVVKAGLIQMTKYTASFMAPVRVNALLPGAIPNLEEKAHRAGKSYRDKFLDRLAERMILGRCGNVTELVGPLIFLASEASSYTTAHLLHADGGWTQI